MWSLFQEEIWLVSCPHPTPLSSLQHSGFFLGLITQPGYILVLFALFCFERYTSASFSIFCSPRVSYLEDGWYDMVYNFSEYHVMSPVVPSRSKGVLAAVEDVHHCTVVIATEHTLSQCLLVPDLQIGWCR